MKDLFKNFQFQKQLLWLNGAIPALMLFIDGKTDNLGANPPEAYIRSTGVIAIIFLSLTLAVTPLAKVVGWNWLMKHRRWLGLFTFYYGCLHLVAYSLFDRSLVFSEIIKDIQKRPFILLGFAGFLMMLPLAITSTNEFIRKMGAKKWKALHKLTYGVAVVIPIHYWLIVKSDIFYPAIFAAVLIFLMLYRIYKYLFSRSKDQRLSKL